MPASDVASEYVLVSVCTKDLYLDSVQRNITRRDSSHNINDKSCDIHCQLKLDKLLNVCIHRSAPSHHLHTRWIEWKGKKEMTCFLFPVSEEKGSHVNWLREEIVQHCSIIYRLDHLWMLQKYYITVDNTDKAESSGTDLHNRSKIVVQDDNIRALLCNFCSLNTHCKSDICLYSPMHITTHQ